MKQITRKDILLSVREKLESQKVTNIDGFSSIIIHSNSATNMIRPPYIMSDAARNILQTTSRWDDPSDPIGDFINAYSGNQ